ncbi:ankyrin-3-like [Branchiostoma floridae]|uniref:Ankyrin-3-like n=1 Tax=Branchiostoma floridae TaxID=7739 RepID=A0A9J7LU77_BRAFL|nr:ankyrin-3-like [Branchiostoma floridae]
MAGNPRQALFLKISRNLVDEELTDLRNYVSGAEILSARFVQKADPHQIFTQLEKEGKLKPGDLSLLADLLRKIGRNDYAEQAEKVAEDEWKKGKKTRKRPTASGSSSTEEAPAKRRKQYPGTKQEAGPSGRKPKVDVSKYFGKVIREASADWDELARELNFDENEIKEIEDERRGNRRRCREMLERWRNRKSKAATLKVLKKALKQIDHKLTADRLEDSSASSESSEDCN